MKKKVNMTGLLLLSATVLIALAISVGLIGEADRDELFVSYIETTMPKLASWEFDEYAMAMSERGLMAATEEQWERHLNKIAVLGTLESVGAPLLKNSRNMTPGEPGEVTYATCLVPLQFDTGPAHAVLGLEYSNEKVKINGVEYLSDVLL